MTTPSNKNGSAKLDTPAFYTISQGILGEGIRYIHLKAKALAEISLLEVFYTAISNFAERRPWTLLRALTTVGGD